MEQRRQHLPSPWSDPRDGHAIEPRHAQLVGRVDQGRDPDSGAGACASFLAAEGATSIGADRKAASSAFERSASPGRHRRRRSRRTRQTMTAPRAPSRAGPRADSRPTSRRTAASPALSSEAPRAPGLRRWRIPPRPGERSSDRGATGRRGRRPLLRRGAWRSRASPLPRVSSPRPGESSCSGGGPPRPTEPRPPAKGARRRAAAPRRARARLRAPRCGRCPPRATRAGVRSGRRAREARWPAGGRSRPEKTNRARVCDASMSRCASALRLAPPRWLQGSPRALSAPRGPRRFEGWPGGRTR